MSPTEDISKIKEASKDNLLSKQNVVGVGVGYKVQNGAQTGDHAIVVMVTKKLPLLALAPEVVLPKIVEGVKIDVIEVGELRALQARTDRWRPAPGGVSIGHYKITAGTFMPHLVIPSCNRVQLMAVMLQMTQLRILIVFAQSISDQNLVRVISPVHMLA
jgi:hypothetical protein